MKSRLFGCGKYEYLAVKLHDNELSNKELAFFEHHEALCATCRKEQELAEQGLNLLRGLVMEPHEVSAGFEDRILRRFRVQKGRESIGYWSPALAGAVVGGLILISALQLISNSGVVPVHRDAGSVGLYFPAENGLDSNRHEDDLLPLVIDPESLKGS
jgi:hypothetical protein